MDTRKLTKLSLMTAISLIIFIIELRLPSICPIQGVKLGLANIITVYAVYQFRPSEVVMMLFVRIVLGSIFSGNVSSFLYSISGGLLCLLGMLLLKRIIPKQYIWICSIIGAILHNTGQIIIAIILMGSIYIITYYPILILSGCIAGLFTGISAQYLVNNFKD